MKLDDALQTLTHFFNDIIGTLIPGLVLALGLVVIHQGASIGDAIKAAHDNGYLIYLAIGLAFALGHAILAAYSVVVAPILPSIKLAASGHSVKIALSRPFILFQAHIAAKVATNPVWQSLPAAQNWTFSDVRNVAMSIPGEAASVGRRFMFISLLCNGVGTALWILAIDLGLVSIFAPTILIQSSYAWPAIFPVFGLILVGAACFRRGDEFFSRALSAPFGIALAGLLQTP